LIARRCYVSGRVQGVFFRASTRQRAELLGITGYVRNLPDGRVEVLACGEPAGVEALCSWLREGPPAASVTDVHVEAAEPASLGAWPADFTQR
jgi:acylphosphatase